MVETGKKNWSVVVGDTKWEIHVIMIMATRPNVVKLAALEKAAANFEHIRTTLVHTGQHYDRILKEEMLSSTRLRNPDHEFIISGVDKSSNQDQMDDMLGAILQKENPDFVLVVGDVNASLLAAQTSFKFNIPIIHVEAGLRSFDSTMPEEHNRILIDKLASFHFVTEQQAVHNLLREGHDSRNIFFVGNVMIDTLNDIISTHNYIEAIQESYAVFTAHRPSNVDDAASLSQLLEILELTSKKIKVRWFLHPRTERRIEEHGLTKRVQKLSESSSISILPSASYSNFVKQLFHAKVVITDSGGIQEESCALGKPCLTIRQNTERPVTIKCGSNRLTPIDNKEYFESVLDKVLEEEHDFSKPEKWDGKAAERIMEEIQKIYLQKYRLDKTEKIEEIER